MVFITFHLGMTDILLKAVPVSRGL